MSYLRKRGDKWYFTIEAKNDNGTRKKIERVGGKTKKEADAAYHAALANLNYGQYKEPENILFKDFLEEWYVDYVQVNLKTNTVTSYRSKLDHHIIPSLGNYKIRSITPLVLQKFLNEKKDLYSEGTLKVLLAVLKKAFSFAIHPCEYIKVNPSEYIKVPKYDTQYKEAHVFTADQLNMIFNKFPAGHLFYMPIMIAYYTGMRLGECLALHWKEINMQERTISVLYTMIDHDGNASISKTPKSKSSIRIIPFSNDLYKILKTHKAKQSANKLEYGKYYKKNDLVCTHDDGSPTISDNIRFFGKYCKETFDAGSFHSLRHTHATMLLENGLDMEYVSKRLGHSSIVLTSKIYSHITQKRHDYALDLMNKIL